MRILHEPNETGWIRKFRGWPLFGLICLTAVWASHWLSSLDRRSPVPARSICSANLKTIDGAKEQWAIEFHQPRGVLPIATDLYGKDLFLRLEPICPASGTYAINPLGQKPKCTIEDHGLEYGVFEVLDKKGKPISSAKVRLSKGWRIKSAQADEIGRVEDLTRYTTEVFAGGTVRVSHPYYQTTNFSFPTNWPARITLKPKSAR